MRVMVTKRDGSQSPRAHLVASHRKPAGWCVSGAGVREVLGYGLDTSICRLQFSLCHVLGGHDRDTGIPAQLTTREGSEKQDWILGRRKACGVS